jgi:hypothetical protein
MLKRSLKRRLLKARITLSDTLQEILELNKKRKRLEDNMRPLPRQDQMTEELKVLNKIAHQQAQLIRYYESNLRDSA